MDIAFAFALGLGIAAVVAGVYLALRTSGRFQYLGGARRSSIPPVNKETLTGRLIALCDLSHPFSIVEGKMTDLVAEGKITELQEFEIAGNGRTSQVYRGHLLLDESRHTVRGYEEMGSVKWLNGPNGPLAQIVYRQSWLGSPFARRKRQEILPEVREEGEPDVLAIERIRHAIVSTVRESGWEWVSVGVKKHALYPPPRRTSAPPAE